MKYKKPNNYQLFNKFDLNSTFKEIYWDPFSMPMPLELTSEMLKLQEKQLKNFEIKSDLINLPDLCFVIITKIDNEFRLNNLKAVIKHLNNHFSNEIIIAEYDTDSKINFNGNYKRFLIEPMCNGFWRNYSANILYQKLGNIKYLFNIESDVIFDPQGIIDCYNQMKFNNYKFCMPFNGLQFWLNKKTTNNFIENNKLPLVWKNIYNLTSDFEVLYFDHEIKNSYLHPGFCYMVDYKTFKKVGLENENFKKHGYDDTERIARYLKHGYEIYYADYFCYHLWHPRNKKDPYYSIDTNNKEEYLRIIKMSLQELKDEIKSWPWLKSTPLN